jgi:hypothetical protein
MLVCAIPELVVLHDINRLQAFFLPFPDAFTPEPAGNRLTLDFALETELVCPEDGKWIDSRGSPCWQVQRGKRHAAE